MKKLLVALVVALLPLALLAQTVSTFDPITELRDQLVKARNSASDAGLAVEEYPEELRKVPAYPRLCWLATDGWRAAMRDLDAVAPDDRAKFYLFTVFQDALDPRSYLEFLEKAAALCAEGKLTNALLEHALMPQGRLRGILADTPSDGQVRAVATRSREAAPQSKPIALLAAAVLSGEARDHLNSLREFDSIPRVSLATNSVLAPSVLADKFPRVWPTTLLTSLIIAAAITGFMIWRRRRSSITSV